MRKIFFCALLALVASVVFAAGNAGPTIAKTVCTGQIWYYTLHVRGPRGDNTLVHVSAVSSDGTTSSASYDPASQTVSGVGTGPGTATITVTGAVETEEGNIPFTQTIVVNVLNCLSVEVCKGSTATVKMRGAAGASSGGPAAGATAGAGSVTVSGNSAGSSVVTVTDANGEPIGRITVKVKNCPPPPAPLISNGAPPEMPPYHPAEEHFMGEICKGKSMFLILAPGTVTGESSDPAVATSTPAGKGGAEISGLDTGTATFPVLDKATGVKIGYFSVKVVDCPGSPPPTENGVPVVSRVICVGEWVDFTNIPIKNQADIGVANTNHAVARVLPPDMHLDQNLKFDKTNTTVSVVGVSPGSTEIIVYDRKTGKYVLIVKLTVKDCTQPDVTEHQPIVASVRVCVNDSDKYNIPSDFKLPAGGFVIRSSRPDVASASAIPSPDGSQIDSLEIQGYREGTATIWISSTETDITLIALNVTVVPCLTFEETSQVPGVQETITGMDLNRVEIDVKNDTSENIVYEIGPGTILVPDDSGYQEMMIVMQSIVEVAAHSEEKREVRANCIQMTKEEPNLLTTFKAEPPSDDTLENIAEMTNQSGFPSTVDQVRVWIYTDHASLADIDKRLTTTVEPSDYLQAMYGLSEKGGVDFSSPDYAKLLDPQLLFDSGDSAESVTWLVDELSQLNPQGLSDAVQREIPTLSGSLRENHAPGDLAHVSDLVSSLCENENHLTRLSGLSLLLNGVPAAERDDKKLNDALESARLLLRSDDPDEVAEAIQVMEAYNYTPSIPSLKSLNTYSHDDKIENLSNAALNAMITK